MKKLLFTLITVMLCAAFFCVGASAKEVGDVNVPMLGDRKAPVIDGRIDADEVWSSVPVILIDESNSRTSWSYRSLVNGTIELKILASDKGFYVAANVVDDTMTLSTDSARRWAGGKFVKPYVEELGYNGDLLIFALDPLSVLEGNASLRNGKGLWYTAAPHEDGTLRIYRSSPAPTDVTTEVEGAYTLTERGWCFEMFISADQIVNDISLFEGVAATDADGFMCIGARNTAMVLYMDRYVYGSFLPVHTAYGGLIDYGNQLKIYDHSAEGGYPDEEDPADPSYGMISTISRWSTGCDTIPQDNLPGNLGNGVAAKLHGIYLNIGADHICTPADAPKETEATCEHRGESVICCCECGKALTYIRRGYGCIPGDWQVVRPATCVVGIEGRYCTRCGVLVSQRPIAAAGKHADGAPVYPGWVDMHISDGRYVFTCTMCEKDVAADRNTITRIYTDLEEGKWYCDAIAYCYEHSLMTGTGVRFFSPDVNMTRAMFVQVLAKLSGAELDLEAHSHFADVADGEWYTAAVCWAYDNGITAGMTETEFDPDGEVTREQVAVFMLKYARFCGIDTSRSISLDGYIDSGAVSAWAYPAMQWAVAERLISGTGRNVLSPKAAAARAQVAQIVANFNA